MPSVVPVLAAPTAALRALPRLPAQQWRPPKNNLKAQPTLSVSPQVPGKGARHQPAATGTRSGLGADVWDGPCQDPPRSQTMKGKCDRGGEREVAEHKEEAKRSAEFSLYSHPRTRTGGVTTVTVRGQPARPRHDRPRHDTASPPHPPLPPHWLSPSPRQHRLHLGACWRSDW